MDGRAPLFHNVQERQNGSYLCAVCPCQHRVLNRRRKPHPRSPPAFALLLALLGHSCRGRRCKWQSGWKRDSPEELGLSHRLSSGRYGASHHSASRPAPGLFEFTGPVVLGQDVSLYGELTQDLDRIPSKVLNLIPAMLS